MLTSTYRCDSSDMPRLFLVHDDTSGPLPTSTFTLTDGVHKCGFIQIRHRPSRGESVPVGFESHVYYEVYEPYRGQGFGTLLFQLGMKEARRLGLREIVLTCYESNTASRRLIEKGGGVLTGSCLVPEMSDEGRFLRYKVYLT